MPGFVNTKNAIRYEYAQALTLPASVAFASTGADDLINCDAPHGLTTGQAVEIVLDGGTAQGITSASLYYAIVTANDKIKLATTYANAVADTPVVVNVTGDAGPGDLYPVYTMPSVGVLYVGATGDVSASVASEAKNANTTLLTYKNVPDAGMLDFAVFRKIGTRLTTATDLVLLY